MWSPSTPGCGFPLKRHILQILEARFQSCADGLASVSIRINASTTLGSNCLPAFSVRYC